MATSRQPLRRRLFCPSTHSKMASTLQFYARQYSRLIGCVDGPDDSLSIPDSRGPNVADKAASEGKPIT